MNCTVLFQSVRYIAILGIFLASTANGEEGIPPDGTPVQAVRPRGCAGIDARSCLNLSMKAMGGFDRLTKTERLDYATLSYQLVPEQSYRQTPFFTSYRKDRVAVDFTNGYVRDEYELTWPESDLPQPTRTRVNVASPAAGVNKGAKGDSPCSRATLDQAAAILDLSPIRILSTAAKAADLRYETPEWLRATPHTVLSFTWHGHRVRLLINQFNQLPDAVETTRTFNDYWSVWGDVRQRVYFDNWHLIEGVVFPTNAVEERNGITISSTQYVSVTLQGVGSQGEFDMDPKAAAMSAIAEAQNTRFTTDNKVELAPGIDLYQGGYNATTIRQDDGILVLEAPSSARFVAGLLDKVREDFPLLPIKAVLSTSDSWPHIGGVREIAALGLPIYVLDLNRPLLDRLVKAPHHQQPDDLEQRPQRPDWRIVTAKTELGVGQNRAVLYPIRGASTERQYMVYFPEHRLLYASDTLVFDDHNNLYDPQLTHEVEQAVDREGLQVDTVFAMHEGPRPWKDVKEALRKASGTVRGSA